MKLHSDILFYGLKGSLEYLNESAMNGEKFLVKVSDNRNFEGRSSNLIAFANILQAVNAIHVYIQQTLAYGFILKKERNHPMCACMFMCVCVYVCV
jgi:hypothetical protein